MRVVIQRVASASVTVAGGVRGRIGPGLLLLAGFEAADADAGRPDGDMDWLCAKVANLRIFTDDAGKMNLSVRDIGGDVLVVSQFTLFAATKKGNRPSFVRAAPPELSLPLYGEFVRRLEAELGRPVTTGEFGAKMAVSLVNDGPVTVTIDTRDRE